MCFKFKIRLHYSDNIYYTIITIKNNFHGDIVMKLKVNKDDILKNNFLKNGELIANRYALNSGTTAFIIITIIWIMNLLKIFVLNDTIMMNCYTVCTIIYIIGFVICKFSDLSKSWVKYFLLLWIVSFVTVLNVFLTFHATITCLLAIVYTTMYSSKRMMFYTCILTMCSVIISVYACRYYGVVDENMLLLSKLDLAVYFILPRCMICAAFSVVCSRVSKVINLNVKYAQKMENQAEIDGMTGLYNKRKYLEMVSSTCLHEEKFAVVFWDINYLKKINDTIGHEAGDSLILTVAESIRKVCNTNDSAYRVGGDEFIMIMRGADEKSVTKKIHDWTQTLNDLKKNMEYDVFVSVGYAYGNGKDLETIIYEAEQMMYENKRLFHKEHGTER